MVITFEAIREVHRKEKESSTLQKIPERFFEEVSEYLRVKEAGKSDPANYIELENARMIVNDIIDRRERKVLEGALAFVRSGIPLDNMLEHEKDLFERVSEILRSHRRDFWNRIKSRKGDDRESESGADEADQEKAHEQIPEEVEEEIEERMEIFEEVEEQEPDFSGVYLALKDLPQFIWTDNRKYLIKEKDILKLPEELASFLEGKGVLKKIKS